MEGAYDGFQLRQGQRLLERYTIVDQAGRGGMATIYRATDERFDRTVCVKLLRTVVGNGGAMYEATHSHFLQEALALSKLQHPNTLKIYDFGYIETDAGAQAPFQISEFLDGGDLDHHVRQRRGLPLAEILSIIDPVGGALAEAHERGIIHRDVKPSNVLFARVGAELIPKLADFGIARSKLQKTHGEGGGDGDDTASAITLFSPRWAAPEQLSGKEEGPETDVYALALVTAFMLSGALPFGDASVRDTFRDRVNGSDLVRARLRQLGIAREVEGVLMLALATDRARRLQKPPDLTVRLRALLQVPQDARPPQPALEIVSEAASAQQPPVGVEVVHAPSPGARKVKYAEVHERLDLSFAGSAGAEVRFRVSFLPVGDSINVKGLSCFVARASAGGRPTPAFAASEDGIASFVSAEKATLGSLVWSFGRRTQAGRVFVVDGEELLLPYPQANHAVLLFLEGGQDLVIMWKRGST